LFPSQINQRLGPFKVMILPNLQEPLWNAPLEEQPFPDGVNDVVALNLLFSGAFPAEMFSQFTEAQLSYYLVFFLKYKDRFARKYAIVFSFSLDLPSH